MDDYNKLSEIASHNILQAKVGVYIKELNKYKNEVEVDPTGLKPSDPGAKLDANKPDLNLVLGDFSRALVEVGQVGTFGANKYSRSGWLSVPNAISRYPSALLRHYFYEKSGELFDPESGLLHAAHLAWNALAYLELKLQELENEELQSCSDECRADEGDGC